MVKLQADITYKWCKQESVLSKSTMANINSEQHINLDNLDEENNYNKDETETEESDDDDDDDSDDDDNDSDDIEERFQNQINQYLEINDNDDDDLDIDDIDVESIEHPAQNKDAKWRLDTIFKGNLYCPF
ncbi:hypothetical protein RclHR1_04200019 [Rhizophagus clarus]|uniref:Uncharacterized protein n=1 Tax=Rhizophagus clarus TaxID=94130 RepID=A0A2Z6RHM5_9GLOM|nr:hypothetical protein RclHR1_04200019 [Rhizophagus clarus]GES97363.1 hypothetical protein GLOIN_2v1472823 [Rhizophagus clarus]